MSASLLPHEYVHSWNGKFRRPADLATPDYQQPMQDDLLWVYEGLTNYLGFVLTARSGLLTADQDRDDSGHHRRRARSHPRPRMAQPAGHRRRRPGTLFLSPRLGIVAPRRRISTMKTR